MNNTKYFNPQKRVLDFSGCRYLGEAHYMIQKELELPEWYGQNLDALWDAVTGLMYIPADITIIYKPEVKGALNSEIHKIIDVFKEAEREYNEITVNVEM